MVTSAATVGTVDDKATWVGSTENVNIEVGTEVVKAKGSWMKGPVDEVTACAT